MISPMSAPTAKTPVTVGATTTAVLAAATGGLRTHATLQASPSNTEPIYLGLGVAAVQDKGIALYPGQSYEIGPANMHVGAINAICASGGQTVRVSSDVAGLGPYPGSESYDASTGADQVWPITRPRLPQDSPQQSASALGDGTTHKYFDVEQGQRFTVRILDTPGSAGDNTYTIHTSQLNDTTAEGSADYQDRTQDFVAQPTVTSADIASDPSIGVMSPPRGFQAKRIRLTCVRANDGANTDGAYQYDAMWS